MHEPNCVCRQTRVELGKYCLGRLRCSPFSLSDRTTDPVCTLMAFREGDHPLDKLFSVLLDRLIVFLKDNSDEDDADVNAQPVSKPSLLTVPGLPTLG